MPLYSYHNTMTCVWHNTVLNYIHYYIDSLVLFLHISIGCFVFFFRHYFLYTCNKLLYFAACCAIQESLSNFARFSGVTVVITRMIFSLRTKAFNAINLRHLYALLLPGIDQNWRNLSVRIRVWSLYRSSPRLFPFHLSATIVHCSQCCRGRRSVIKGVLPLPFTGTQGASH